MMAIDPCGSDDTIPQWASLEAILRARRDDDLAVDAKFKLHRHPETGLYHLEQVAATLHQAGPQSDLEC